MMSMQNMLDRIFTNKDVDINSNLMFVNGDCTKWSAAETMSSFVSMLLGFKDRITQKMYQLILSTFNIWSKKKKFKFH